MKYYLNPKDDEAKNIYITKVIRNSKNGTFTVTYASGLREDNIVLNDGNAEKIEKKLHEQADLGVKNRHVIRRKQITGAISRVGACVASSIALAGGILSQQVSEEAMLVTTIGAGVLCVGGILLGKAKYNKEQGTLNEIDNYQYRQEHMKEAVSYLHNSPNAYKCFDVEGADGKADKKARRSDAIFSMLEQGRNPFGLLEVNTGGITDKEFDRLVKGATREEKLGFEYTKSK